MTAEGSWRKRTGWKSGAAAFIKDYLAGGKGGEGTGPGRASMGCAGGAGQWAPSGHGVLGPPGTPGTPDRARGVGARAR
ncbi:hypothetical protein GCM10010430_66900 [Kitasatospora cystarginea]|uniref:Uncharacterized protein n=1 Tax=Kitasatospora cystarginea TaxID=58350 RepID=A0ABN3EUA5_9ACTN